MQRYRLLVRAQTAIQEADRLSARVFAPSPITRALSLHDQALEKRRKKQWVEALKLAERAEKHGQEAIAICREKQNTPGEALLYDAKGKVEQFTKGVSKWKNIPSRTILREDMQVRTQTAAWARIHFADDSRLRLYANSRIIIRKLRSDLLRGQESASIGVLAGEVFSLRADRTGNAFNIEIAGVTLGGNSNNFYLRRDAQAKGRRALFLAGGGAGQGRYSRRF
ncbi:MAG: FecR domain-containing protein [Gammaproteobacteria bacterium]|nr:FecR domain-containing protein [Gammaproteobacteria bacterium]